MDRRVEQRLQVYTPVKLTLLDQPEQRELDCLLVDISGAGMKLVADVELPEGKMVSIEAGPSVVLAEVRYCSPRSGKFGIGVEKVHVMPAAILDQHANKAARLQALVDNYRVRINEGIEAAVGGPDLFAAIAPEPMFTPEAVLQSHAVSEVEAGGPAETAFAAPRPETELPTPQSESAAPVPSGQAEVSLDPIRAALEAVVQPVQPVRSRLTPKMAGAALGAVLVAALLVAPFKGRLSSFPGNAVAAGKKSGPEEPARVPSAGEPVSSTLQKPAPSVAPAPVHPVVTAGVPGKGHASFKFTESNWASVCADGQKLFERLFSASEVREITFSGKAVVRLGNAGAVEIALNGEPLGSAGQPGQLRLLELTSAGLRPLPMGDPADDCLK